MKRKGKQNQDANNTSQQPRSKDVPRLTLLSDNEKKMFYMIIRLCWVLLQLLDYLNKLNHVGLLGKIRRSTPKNYIHRFQCFHTNCSRYQSELLQLTEQHTILNLYHHQVYYGNKTFRVVFNLIILLSSTTKNVTIHSTMQP